MLKWNACARWLLHAAMLERWPHVCQDHVYMCHLKRSCLDDNRPIRSFPHQQIRWNAWYTAFHRKSAFAREVPKPTLRSARFRFFGQLRPKFLWGGGPHPNECSDMHLRPVPGKMRLEGKLESRPTVTRLNLGCLILNSILSRSAVAPVFPARNGHRNTKRNPRWWKLMSLFKWALWTETCDDHRGFRFVFQWPFRVSSSRERPVSGEFIFKSFSESQIGGNIGVEFAHICTVRKWI